MRMALGADATGILTMVLRQGAVQAALGTVAGVAIAFAIAAAMGGRHREHAVRRHWPGFSDIRCRRRAHCCSVAGGNAGSRPTRISGCTTQFCPEV